MSAAGNTTEGESVATIVEVKGLKKYFPVTRGLLSKTVGWVKAVDDISFSVEEGKTYVLVGESGCGKTTTAKIILSLEKPTSGSILFRGKETSRLTGEELSQFRASVQAVFQDPFASLSPRMRVESIVGEPLEINKKNLTKVGRQKKIKEVLSQVGLDQHALNLFPHEFSGGQRQRIAVARSLSVSPSLIILDEPVSALDVSIRAQIMNLLKDLQEQLNVAYLLIAHNLATVRYLGHQMGVMYLGKLVEKGPVGQVFSDQFHPYTRALISAALPSHPDLVKDEIVLAGEVPSALNPPSGCHFHTRCNQVMPICSKVNPELKKVAPGHEVACHIYASA